MFKTKIIYSTNVEFYVQQIFDGKSGFKLVTVGGMAGLKIEYEKTSDFLLQDRLTPGMRLMRLSRDR